MKVREMDMLTAHFDMEIGPQAFSAYLYPENGCKRHFISERRRSEKF